MQRYIMFKRNIIPYERNVISRSIISRITRNYGTSDREKHNFLRTTKEFHLTRGIMTFDGDIRIPMMLRSRTHTRVHFSMLRD